MGARQALHLDWIATFGIIILFIRFASAFIFHLSSGVLILLYYHYRHVFGYTKWDLGHTKFWQAGKRIVFDIDLLLFILHLVLVCLGLIVLPHGADLQLYRIGNHVVVFCCMHAFF